MIMELQGSVLALQRERYRHGCELPKNPGTTKHTSASRACRDYSSGLIRNLELSQHTNPKP